MTDQLEKRIGRSTCGVGTMFMREKDELGESSRHLLQQPPFSTRTQQLANGISDLGDRMQSLEEKVSQSMPGNTMPSARTLMEREEMKVAARALSRCQDLPDGLRTATDAVTKQARQTEDILQRVLQAQVQLMSFMERVHRDASMQLGTQGQSLEDIKSGLTTLLDTTRRSEQKAEQIVAQFKESELPASGRHSKIVPTLQLPVLPEGPVGQPQQGFDQSVRTSRESETAGETEIVPEIEGKILAGSPDKGARMPVEGEPVQEDTSIVQSMSPKDQCDEKAGADAYKDKAQASVSKMIPWTDRLLVQHFNPPDTPWASVVNSHWFASAAGFLIVLNTLMLGVQVEIELSLVFWPSHAKEGWRAETSWFKWMNLTFLVFFGLELFMRISAERCHFFTGKQRAMNLFECLLICVSTLEEVSKFVQDHDLFTGNVSFIRAIKILRLGQTLRVLKLFRYSSALHLMAGEILSSFKSLAWAFFLMFILVFCSSCFVCKSVVNWCHRDEFFREDEEYDNMKELFGTMPRTMYSLILAVSGGMDWGDIVKPWTGIDRSVVLVLVFYVLFVVFGMLNVLTGVFCDKAREASQMDRDIIVEAEKANIEQFVEKLQEEFQAIDTDHSGKVSLSEFRVYIQSEDVQAYLAHMGISVDKSVELFRILPKDQDGLVDMEHFIRGVLRMRGGATSIETMKLRDEIGHLKFMLIMVCKALGLEIKRQSVLKADDLTRGFASTTQ